MWKLLTVWIIANCGKLLKRWEYQTILAVSWETCTRVKKQQLEPYMEQLTGSILGNECDKAVYYHPAYFYAEYIMRNAGLDESQAEIENARRNINNLRYADNTTLMEESEEEQKSLLMRVKEESEKAGLKLNI